MHMSKREAQISRWNSLIKTAPKFIDVARDDGIAYGALKPRASFTITASPATPWI